MSHPVVGLPSSAAVRGLGALFAGEAFELRFSVSGRAAVRLWALRGPVAARHAESTAPVAVWSASARCGGAVGWLLAGRAPEDERGVRELLQRTVDRHCALVLQRLVARGAGVGADLLDGLTHGLRTDVSTLQTLAEALARGVLEESELVEIPGRLAAVGGPAQRRLSAVREVMPVLEGGGGAGARRPPEPLEETLRAELDGAGARVAIAGAAGERPMVGIPGAGWAACARRLAGALAHDERLGGERAAVTVSPHPDGWAVTAGRRDSSAQAVTWSEAAVGELVVAGQIAVAAGGWASGVQGSAGHLQVELVLPAEPSGPRP
ncbi:MAG TPA: hypothetical protein VGM33_22630 [Baekduia sp.]